MNRPYVHGYDERESIRLQDQARSVVEKGSCSQAELEREVRRAIEAAAGTGQPA